MAQSLQDTLHPSSIASIVRRYENGESSTKLAADYGVSPVSLRRLLRAQGVKIKGPGRYPAAK